MKNALRHRFNPLHVYCRLCDIGMDAARAMAMVRRYEVVYRLFL